MENEYKTFVSIYERLLQDRTEDPVKAMYVLNGGALDPTVVFDPRTGQQRSEEVLQQAADGMFRRLIKSEWAKKQIVCINADNVAVTDSAEIWQCGGIHLPNSANDVFKECISVVVD